MTGVQTCALPIWLGTNVISTDVGIISEIFTEENNPHISLPSADAFHMNIHDLVDGNMKEDLEKLYSNYIRQAFSEEFIFKYKNNEVKFSNYSGFYKYIKIRAFWAYRFIKNKLG